MSMATTDLYIPLLPPGTSSGRRTLRHPSRHPPPPLPPPPPRPIPCCNHDGIFSGDGAKGAPVEIPWRLLGLVSLICISRLMHPSSGIRRWPCALPLVPSRCISAHNHDVSGGWYRGRGRPRPPAKPFVVRGSRQAKFADEVRINELQIKTGRAALMARLNKVPSIRPRPRRDQHAPFTQVLPRRLIFL
jgi:hypothetical protein